MQLVGFAFGARVPAVAFVAFAMRSWRKVPARPAGRAQMVCAARASERDRGRANSYLEQVIENSYKRQITG
jgi:hypothetical protein